MARTTYVRRIASIPEDISPTLAMGMSFDHIIATTLPFGASIIWAMGGNSGYIYVFLGGLGISVINLILASRIRFANKTTEVEETT